MTSSAHVKSPYKILITSASPYVNNIPHMGNIIGCVLSADVFARYNRSQGNQTLYICGTDEHGTATETKALEEGLTPKELCDKYYKVHKEVYDWFNISFDHFGRTSEENHARITQEIFKDLHANGYILEKDVEQTYCETDKRFLADRFVEGECPHCHFANDRGDQCDNCGKLLNPEDLINPKCKLCGNTPIRKTSRHLFLDLEKLQPKVQEWIAHQAKAGAWSQNAITTATAWLERGLEPRAITRDLSWGVPVPLKGFEKKVFYVWFDAPIGYISITGQFTTDWRDWWHDPKNVRLYQFMAKDNIPFHTILFPASQLGTKKSWTMLHHIDATEYLQTEDGKFSKSRGTGLFSDDAMRTGLPSDVYRYYLLVNRPGPADTVFAWKDLQEKLNKELLANFGNLVNRTLSFIAQFQGSTIHEAVLDEQSANFWQWVTEEEVQVTDELERCKEKDALRRIMSISTKANAYFQEQQPWRARTENPEQCRMALFLLANLIKDLAIMIEPFLPQTSKEIFGQLSLQQQSWKELGNLTLANHRIGTPKPLFAKLEDKDLAKIKEILAAKKPQPTGDEPLLPLTIRVGKIIDVKQHPNANKLLVETVDFGTEQRTIVSGLVGHYTPEQLQGRNALFVTNLKPANLRGVESNGMILAAQTDGKVEVLFTDADPGTTAEPTKAAPQVTIDEFGKHAFTVTGHVVHLDGRQVVISGSPVRTRHVKNGVVK